MKLKLNPHIYALIPVKGGKGYERHAHDDFESATKRIHDSEGNLIPGASIEWGVITKDVSVAVDAPPVLAETAILVYGDTVINCATKEEIAAARLLAEKAAKEPK